MNRVKKLRQEVVKILNFCDWNDKDKVDLRSIESMLNYLKFYEKNYQY